MRKVIHVVDCIDLETDTMIRIDSNLGQEVDLIRQNLAKVTFQKNSETEETHV